jgi:hypothetical protein
MAIPITVRCECGETHSVDLGDNVECSCGRRYDTASIPPERFAYARSHQARIRLYMQLGTIFMLTGVVLAAVLWGLKGVAVAIPLAGLLWFLFFGKWLRKRWLHGPRDQSTYQLEASER